MQHPTKLLKLSYDQIFKFPGNQSKKKIIHIIKYMIPIDSKRKLISQWDGNILSHWVLKKKNGAVFLMTLISKYNCVAL